MLLFAVDASSPVAAYRQLCDRVVALVDEGALRPGDRLPPTRRLAELVGLHRSTVVRTYEELRALGYIESRAGSYSTVRRRARPPATHREAQVGPASGLEGAIDWSARATRGARAALTDAAAEGSPDRTPADTIDFERLGADPSLAPSDGLRRCLKSALVQERGAALDYADALGLFGLREVIAARLRAHGIAATAPEVLITGGAQQALDLALRLLTRPGDSVAVEAPTYGMAHTLLRLHGLVPVEVPMRGDGMDLDALERTLGRRRPKVLYTMPNFQNPTGITTSQPHRERLLALCEEHRVPILEDGFEEEMKYSGQAVLPIKSMDERGLVLYVGTFSKVVFPGLRVGWIAAPPEAVTHLAAIQRASCLAGNTLAQTALARFCGGGLFESYLRRVHRVYRRRMQAMLGGLAEHLPAGLEWTTPVGGYTLWLRLPGAASDEASICERLAQEGVKVAPGRRFFATCPDAPYARLSIACVDEARIGEGCRRLGSALRPGRPAPDREAAASARARRRSR